jgi:hypothetical protein
MEQTADNYDIRWGEIIKQMPIGGNYRFDQRKGGYKVILDYIGKGKKVFDYACGLGVMLKMARQQYDCDVSGCDFSTVAIGYTNETVSGDFRVGDKIWGKYDYVVASQFIEHIKTPAEWIENALDHAEAVICSIPNNFSRHGDHIDMQWGNWDEFNELFKGFNVERIDTPEKYAGTAKAWQHPTFVFRRK